MAKRGRPAGSKNKQKGTVRQDLTGHNSGIPSEGVILHHNLCLTVAQAKIKEHQDAIKEIGKKIWKDAKNDGVDLKKLKLIRELDKLTHGQQVEDHNRTVAYGKAIGLDLSRQLTMIDLMQADNSPAAIDQRAYDAGLKDGKLGKDQDRDVYDITTPAGQRYIAGWQDGQKVNREALLKMESPKLSDDDGDEDPPGDEKLPERSAAPEVPEPPAPPAPIKLSSRRRAAATPSTH